LFNLFVAGHEATAITVTWALYLLTQHSNVRQRSVSGMLYVCVCVCLCMCM
jgi:cytochrome P450